MQSRIGLLALLWAAAVAATEQTDGIASYMEFGALMASADQLNKVQSICTTLFPSQAEVILGHYQASSVPRYVNAFGFQVPPSLSGDRDKLLETLKKSEGEMSAACVKEFPEALNRFDAKFAMRADEWIPAIEQMTAATEISRPPTPVEATPALDRLFANIAERSKRAYQTNDWSVLAELYEPGTFDCWRGVTAAEQFAFLSFEPLSEKAKFEVSEFTEYMLGNDFEFSRASPTHFMEIHNAISTPGGRCGLEKVVRWPTLHFFLVQRDGEFYLTHFCPSREAVASDQLTWGRPRSAAQATANIAQLDAADWEAIAADVKRDRFNSGIQDRLSQKHGFSYDEADEAVRYVCDPANVP